MSSPLLKAQDAFQQLVTSCTTGSPPLIELACLEEAGRAEDMRLRLLFSAEDITFMHYIAGRYGEEVLQQLLTEYSKGVIIQEAAEKAFNTRFTDLEKDWRALVEKTAAKLGSCEGELVRIRRAGYNTERAERIKKEQPFLALLVAYIAEQYGVPSPTPLSPETAPPAKPEEEPQTATPPGGVPPPNTSFPWLLFVFPVVVVGAVVGIIKLIIKAVRRGRT